MSVLIGLRFATRSKTVKDTLDAAKQLMGLGDYSERGPDPEAAEVKAKSKDDRIDLYNKLSIWFFVLGLAAMIIFICVNVLFETAASLPYPR